MYWSIIDSVFNIIYEKKLPIAEDHLIASFFQAKRKLEVTISRTEIQQVVTHVRSWDQNEELDVAQLQKKTVIWIGRHTCSNPCCLRFRLR